VIRIPVKQRRAAVSPVIATVILVAVAIVIAIAVAFWATGLVGVFTRFEKLEVTSAFATSPSGGASTVSLSLKSSGTIPATVDSVVVNGAPCDVQDRTLNPGDTDTLTVDIGAGGCELPAGSVVSGITVEMAVHTAAGKLYPSAVLIP